MNTCTPLVRLNALIYLLVVVGILAAAPPATASVHLWQIDHIYSDATGNRQYVQMLQTPPQDGERFFLDAVLSSNGSTFVFPSNLPSHDTSGRSLLLGTEGFADLHGAVEPDFTIPANFFALDGDTITFEDPGGFGTIDTFTFDSGELPLNGLHALDRQGNVILNAPTNFAGETGFVPEPTTAALVMLAAIIQGCRCRRRTSV